MTGPRIRQWFDTVALNNADWYRNIAVSVPGKVNEKGEVFAPESWESFVSGWIHCTTGMFNFVKWLIVSAFYILRVVK